MNIGKFIRHTHTLVPWFRQGKIQPRLVHYADGPYIYSQGSKIVDFTAGAMVVNLGHNNQYIKKAFHENIDTGIAYVPSNFATYDREKLSDRLIDIRKLTNGKVLYGNAGADCNEMATFLATEYHRINGSENKIRTLSFEQSFHGGSTIGASLLSGDARRQSKTLYYSLPLEPIMPNPSMEDDGKESLKHIEKLLTEDVSSIVVEGSSGSAGCILYPDNYLFRLKKMCEERNILLICDEVMSGFGRTGEIFAHFKQNIVPDIITCAKAITCGYSQLGAVILNNKVSESYNDNPVMCGLTYSGHPLGCRIANKCLDLYLANDMKVIQNVNNKGLIMAKLGTNIANQFDFITEYRNNGLLGCFELNLNEDKLAEVSAKFLDNEIYCMRIRQNIFTAPPLNISDELLIQTMNKMAMVFESLEN